MQMLAESSEETSGLRWIKGKVRKFDYASLPPGTILPHMGWNTIMPDEVIGLFEYLPENSRFYFLHSYYFECLNEKVSLPRLITASSLQVHT